MGRRARQSRTLGWGRRRRGRGARGRGATAWGRRITVSLLAGRGPGRQRASVTDPGPFDHLPLAPPGLEADAARRFRTELSPDEYAARFGHDFVLFSYHDYRYRQPGLTEWVQRLG